MESIRRSHLEYRVMGNIQNSEDCISVNLKLNLYPDIDKEKVAKYLEKIFVIANKFEEMLHKEKLTIGEALFIVYMLENGALSTISAKDDKMVDDKIYETLVEGNDTRLNIMTNIIIKNSIG